MPLKLLSQRKASATNKLLDIWGRPVDVPKLYNVPFDSQPSCSSHSLTTKGGKPRQRNWDIAHRLCVKTIRASQGSGYFWRVQRNARLFSPLQCRHSIPRLLKGAFRPSPLLSYESAAPSEE